MRAIRTKRDLEAYKHRHAVATRPGLMLVIVVPGRNNNIPFSLCSGHMSRFCDAALCHRIFADQRAAQYVHLHNNESLE